MCSMTLIEANEFLAELMREPEGAPAVLMRGRKPIAVILPVGKADYETVSLSFSPTFNAIMLVLAAAACGGPQGFVLVDFAALAAVG